MYLCVVMIYIRAVPTEISRGKKSKWMLGTKTWSYVRTTSTLNHWAISPVPRWKVFILRQVLLCSPGWPGTCHVDQYGLKSRDLPVFLYFVLGFQACPSCSLLENLTKAKALEKTARQDIYFSHCQVASFKRWSKIYVTELIKGVNGYYTVEKPTLWGKFSLGKSFSWWRRLNSSGKSTKIGIECEDPWEAL